MKVGGTFLVLPLLLAPFAMSGVAVVASDIVWLLLSNCIIASLIGFASSRRSRHLKRRSFDETTGERIVER